MRILLVIMYGLVSMGFHSNSILKNKMRVKWTIEPEFIKIRMNAPTQGWVAVGFNNLDQLKGSNLIMACIENEQLQIEDHYIMDVGDHRTMESIGGINCLSSVSGSETSSETTVEFKLPKTAIDNYHLDLRKGKELYLIMSYSIEDDFNHHSTMRTSAKIKL